MTTIFNLRGTFGYGMHGCGYYKGTKHANTYEGFKYWRSRGESFIEVDIARTLDGRYVALAHKMITRDLRRLEINDFSATDVFTHNWYMRQVLFCKSTNGLTPMDVKMIINELKEDKDLIVMFDLYGMWLQEETELFSKYLLQINDDERLFSRILVEAYNQDMINGINNASNGEIPIIYCVHEDSAGAHHQFLSASVLNMNNIYCISYPWSYHERYAGELEEFASNNFIIVSLSKDNRYAKKMQRGGVNIALVDNIYHKGDFLIKYPIYLAGRLKNLLVQKMLKT